MEKNMTTDDRITVIERQVIVLTETVSGLMRDLQRSAADLHDIHQLQAQANSMCLLQGRLVQVEEVVDRLAGGNAAQNEKIRRTSDFNERFQASGYSAEGDVFTISSPVYVVKDGVDR